MDNRFIISKDSEIEVNEIQPVNLVNESSSVIEIGDLPIRLINESLVDRQASSEEIVRQTLTKPRWQYFRTIDLDEKRKFPRIIKYPPPEGDIYVENNLIEVVDVAKRYGIGIAAKSFLSTVNFRVPSGKMWASFLNFSKYFKQFILVL